MFQHFLPFLVQTWKEGRLGPAHNLTRIVDSFDTYLKAVTGRYLGLEGPADYTLLDLAAYLDRSLRSPQRLQTNLNHDVTAAFRSIDLPSREKPDDMKK